MNKHYKRVSLRLTEEHLCELVTEANRLAAEQGEAYPHLCSTALAIWTLAQPPVERNALIVQMVTEMMHDE